MELGFFNFFNFSLVSENFARRIIYMKRRILISLSSLVFTLCATGQNGNKKEHNNMNDIVPKDLIPDAPVLNVEEAIKAFTIQEGFTIEAVVAEPLVDKPVALDFDARGRMWVCEMRGYMSDIDGTEEETPMGRIVILEDSNKDGQVDKRTVFLDKILLPRTIAVVADGVLIGDHNSLYHVARNGDQPAGELKVIDEKYSAGGNVEHKPNGMITALDNWMYNAKSGFRYQWKNGELKKEPTLFRGQWGITQDNWGHLYYNSNSTMLIGDRFAPNLLHGNSKVKIKQNISRRVGNNNVYPGRITPGLNRAYISKLNGYKNNIISPENFKLLKCTAACGPVIYRGDNFPAKFQGMAFVAESGAQLIKAVALDRKKGDIKGSHPYKKSEFLTSTDERFRPVNLYNAPDGSLYVLDMYHGIIQHKTYMTSYLRRQTLSRNLDKPGLGHGRIYRIRAVDRPLTPVPDLENANQEQLVKALKSENGLHRDIAQRRLVAMANSLSSGVRSLLEDTQAPLASRAQALWTLEGVGALETKDISTAFAANSPKLMQTGMYAALSLSETDRQALLPEIIKVANDPATLPYKTRLLASIPTEEAQEALVALLKKNGKNKMARMAAISGLEDTAELFKKVNKKRYSARDFNDLLNQSAKEPKKVAAAEDILKGDHLKSYKRGESLYVNCMACHGADGAGLANLGPLLDQSNWVTEDPEDLTKVLLFGLQGPIKINGKMFTSAAVMPGLAQNDAMKDQDLADIITYIRHAWSNRASQVKAADVTKIRNAHKGQGVMSAADFPAKQ